MTPRRTDVVTIFFKVNHKWRVELVVGDASVREYRTHANYTNICDLFYLSRNISGECYEPCNKTKVTFFFLFLLSLDAYNGGAVVCMLN